MITLAIVGDLHANSTIGLCPPTVNLDDGGTYHASKAQLWLWQNWLDYWKRVSAARTALKGRLVVILNGDMVDGDHHETAQIITRNMATQWAIAEAVLAPALDLNPDEIYVIRGTPAHVGKSAQWEEAVARNIGAVPEAERIHSWWQLRRVFGGVRVDVAHHGRMGNRPWTRSNAAQMMAAEITYLYARNGWALPHLAIRSHRHLTADSYDNHPVRVIQAPAWQLQTEYAHKVATGQLADIGGLIVTCNEGRFWVDKALYGPEETDPWKESS